MFYDFFILFIKFLLRGKYHTTKIKYQTVNQNIYIFFQNLHPTSYIVLKIHFIEEEARLTTYKSCHHGDSWF